MSLKNAVAVCLISLFSATLVVLIARTLDSQAAAQLQPQLAAIVEELRAIRKQGGMTPPPAAPAADSGVKVEAASETPADGLVVYYFHGNSRCPTCESIEAQAHEVVQGAFGAQLAGGAIAWKVLNYQAPANAALAKKFGVLAPVVVVARADGREIGDWKRLDQVWALVNDRKAFADFLTGEIRAMLSRAQPPAGETPKSIATPVPADLPVPK